MSTDWLCPCNQRSRNENGFLNAHSTACAFFNRVAHISYIKKSRKDTSRIIRVIICITQREQTRSEIKQANVPSSMLIPLLHRSRRHLVASIHPAASLSILRCHWAADALSLLLYTPGSSITTTASGSWQEGMGGRDAACGLRWVSHHLGAEWEWLTVFALISLRFVRLFVCFCFF